MQITKPTKHTGLHLPPWQSTRRYSLTGAVALAYLLPQLPGMAETPGTLPESYTWQKVVNNLNFVPGTDSKPFNSYNQPSVNASGLIVFRARSKGPEVMSGIYQKDMKSGAGVQKIADRNTTVPAPKLINALKLSGIVDPAS
jgi:hypothetical protein